MNATQSDTTGSGTVGNTAPSREVPALGGVPSIAMPHLPHGLDVAGPVQAEVFVVWLNGDRLELTGPCGSAPWLIESGVDDHPLEVVSRIVRETIGAPILVHSTSWRRDREAVILSFVVVIDAACVGTMETAPIERVDLARSEPTAAPRAIAHAQVVEHGLRHLAWLVQDDPVVAAELSPAWVSTLAGYVPEPTDGAVRVRLGDLRHGCRGHRRHPRTW